jgi:hypothetical protein
LPILTPAGAEEPAPRVAKRKRVQFHVADDDPLNDSTPRATKGETSNPSKNAIKAGVKPKKPSLRAVRALQVAKAEVFHHLIMRTYN